MRILECIEKNGNGNYLLYKTKKVLLDATNNDTISYDDKSVSHSTKGDFAETDKRRIKTVQIPMDLILNVAPIFSYFLDGSRHIYKSTTSPLAAKSSHLWQGRLSLVVANAEAETNSKKPNYIEA